jgi:hypothetical protein
MTLELWGMCSTRFGLGANADPSTGIGWLFVFKRIPLRPNKTSFAYDTSEFGSDWRIIKAFASYGCGAGTICQFQMFLFVFFGSRGSISFATIGSSPLHGQFQAFQLGQFFGFDVGVNVTGPGRKNVNLRPNVAL